MIIFRKGGTIKGVIGGGGGGENKNSCKEEWKKNMCSQDEVRKKNRVMNQ